MKAIQPEELRVGNNLYNDGIIVTIDGRTIFDLSYGIKTERYKPIELTEEILLRAGAKKDLDDSFVLGRIAIFLDKRFKENVYFETSDSGTFSSSSWVKIDGLKCYELHHLQNIVKDLTGKELTLNK